MMRASLVVLAGCGFQGPALHDGGAPTNDAHATSDATDASAPPVCFGAMPFQVCVPMPQAPLEIAGSAMTTTAEGATCAGGRGVVATMGGVSVCVLAGTSAILTGTTRTTGDLPLVIASLTTLEVAGTLDVASHKSGDPGAGAIGAVCLGATTISGTNAASGAGGGAGGSFGGAGGRGGDGPVGAPGGLAPPLIQPPIDVLRGGCAGGPGGSGSGVKSVGGDGGGAVYLVANQSITIEGAVDASGGGGRAGLHGAGGGGGGGSGGMIVLAAPAIAATGTLFANGGGGAGGATNNTDGHDGTDPTSAFAAASPGGAAGGQATNGGIGGFGTTNGGSAMQAGAASGAGGAGGGTGVIRVLQGGPLGGSVSPPPS
jgi:hypothetical protein